MNFDSDILIVDDKMSNLRLPADLLENEGYKVRQADNAKMAIDSAIFKPPGLFLLDLRLPATDGVELCRHLKQDKRTQHVPIIFISPLNDTEAKIRGLEEGGVDFISNPFQEPEIIKLSIHQLHPLWLLQEY